MVNLYSTAQLLTGFLFVSVVSFCLFKRFACLFVCFFFAFFFSFFFWDGEGVGKGRVLTHTLTK